MISNSKAYIEKDQALCSVLFSLPANSFDLSVCLALSSPRFAFASDLLGDIPNGRITQPVMPFRRVIAMSHFELLQEPDQADWAKFSRQRLQSR